MLSQCGGALLAFILASSAALQPPHVVVVGGGVGGLADLAGDSRSAAPASPCSRRTTNSAAASANTRGSNTAGRPALLYCYSSRRLPRYALTAAGAAQLDIKRVAPAYAVWYEQHADRGPVILGGDRSELRRRLELEAPRGGFERFEEYRATAREYLRAGWPIFIEEDISPPSLLKLVPRFLIPPSQHSGSGLCSATTRSYVDCSRTRRGLRALCSFEDLYVGLTPVEAPAGVFSLLAAIELDNALAEP